MGSKHSLALQPSAGKGRNSPRWALGAGARTFDIPHLLPIWIPLVVDLHPQAFSPEPQSIQNKPWLFICSYKSMQTSAVLLGCVGPRRLQHNQCGTRDGELVAEGGEEEPLEQRQWSPGPDPERPWSSCLRAFGKHPKSTGPPRPFP